MGLNIEFLDFNHVTQVDFKKGHLYSIDANEELLEAGERLLKKYMEDQPAAFQEFELFKSVVSTINNSSLAQEDDYINDFLVEIEWIIEEPVKDSPEYVRAQLMTYVFLISSRLAFNKIPSSKDIVWLDPRDILITDDTWIESSLDLNSSKIRWNRLNGELTYITTHGIACTSSNENTLTSEKKTWKELI